MKGTSEIMAEALGRVFRGVWLWRVCTVVFAVCAVQHMAGQALDEAFARFGAQTWLDYAAAKARAVASGLPFAVPSREVAMQMNYATAFYFFITFVFGGIVLLATATVMLKAARDDSDGWLKASFSGFSRPLGVAWLMFSVFVRIALWSMLLVLPGVVASYRYSQCWNVKSENPDWSASQCISESSRMMAGYKMRRFLLDLPFLLMALVLVVALGMARGGEPGPAASAVFALGALFIALWSGASRAVFYRELKGCIQASALDKSRT